MRDQNIYRRVNLVFWWLLNCCQTVVICLLIMRCHDTLAKQINNVLCFFRKLDPMIKLGLLVSYCYSLYGSVLWDACSGHLEQLCRTWRVAVRRVWGLPHNTHNFLLPLICCRLPLYDEFMSCCVCFSVLLLKELCKTVIPTEHHSFYDSVFSPFASKHD